MPEWYRTLDEGQRRILLALGSVVAAMALVVGGVVLTGDDDPDEAQVETQAGATSSTTVRSSTTSTSSSSTTTSSVQGSTSTTKAAAGRGGTTTTTRRAGGGTGTTRPTTATTKPTTTTPTTQPSGGPCATGGGAGGQLATLFCNHRSGLGRPSMSRNGQLDAMAQAWAQQMSNDGALSHRPNAEARQMVAASCACPGWAEIVAYDDTVQGAFQGWLAWAAHRGHIEDGRDGEYGIGVQGIWFVMVFGYYG